MIAFVMMTSLFSSGEVGMEIPNDSVELYLGAQSTAGEPIAEVSVLVYLQYKLRKSKWDLELWVGDALIQSQVARKRILNTTEEFNFTVPSCLRMYDFIAK